MMRISNPMKVSLACSVGILMAGALLKRKAGEDARDAARTAHKEAVGNSSGSPDRRSAPAAVSDAPPLDFSRIVRSASTVEQRMQGTMISEEERQEERDLLATLRASSPARLEGYIDQVLSSEEISVHGRRLWVSECLRAMAIRDPEKALGLFGKHKGLFEGTPMAQAAVSNILGEMARKDAKAAFERLDQFVAMHPEFDRKNLILATVRIAGQKNEALLYQILRRNVEPLGHDAVQPFLTTMSMTADTEEKSLAVMDYLRSYLPTVEDEEKRRKVRDEAVKMMAFKLGRREYQATVDWMKAAGLSREETLVAGIHMSINSREADSGLWLQWLDREIPFDSLGEAEKKTWHERVDSIIRSWADSDTVAVGRWIESQEPGPLRDRSTCRYIYETCEENPEVAEKWVSLLRYENAREYMLNQIYNLGDFESHEAREAFAKRNKLK